MASIIAPLAISGSRKAGGEVNAGGFVRLTRIGATQSPVVGYSDRDAKKPLPLEGDSYRLDDAGKLAVFVNEPCRVSIYDSLGAPVDAYADDACVSAGLVEVISPRFSGVSGDSVLAGGRTFLLKALNAIASSIGGAIGTDGMYVGRGAKVQYGRTVASELDDVFVNAKRFGVKGNGLDDDTVQLQDAVDYASGVGATVYLPPGKYRIQQVIPRSNMSLKGAGRHLTSLQGFNLAENLIVFPDGCSNIDLSDMSLTTGIPGTPLATAISFAGTADGVLIRNVAIDQYFADGIIAAGAVTNTNFEHVRIAMNPLSGHYSFYVPMADCTLFDVTSLIASTIVIPSGSLRLKIDQCDSLSVQTGVTDVFGEFLGDDRVIGSAYVEAAGNRTVTPPDDVYSRGMTIKQLNNGGVVTIEGFPTKRPGQIVSFMLINASAGATTWTFDAAAYHLDTVLGAPAPASGRGIGLTFMQNPQSGLFYECAGRSSVVG